MRRDVIANVRMRFLPVDATSLSVIWHESDQRMDEGALGILGILAILILGKVVCKGLVVESIDRMVAFCRFDYISARVFE